MERSMEEQFPGLYPPRRRRALLEKPQALEEDPEAERAKRIAKLRETLPGLFKF